MKTGAALKTTPCGRFPQFMQASRSVDDEDKIYERELNEHKAAADFIDELMASRAAAATAAAAAAAVAAAAAAAAAAVEAAAADPLAEAVLEEPRARPGSEGRGSRPSGDTATARAVPKQAEWPSKEELTKMLRRREALLHGCV